jgi:PAS domain S-box-containing protein
MKNIRIKEIGFILIGTMVFWLMDTMVDEFIFMKRSFLDAILLNVPSHEIFIRFTTVVAIVVFGILIMRYSNRLNESEGRYRQLFDNINDAIFIQPFTTSDIHAKFIEGNAGATRILGYSRDELLKLSLADTIPPENRREPSAVMQRLLAERHVLYDTVQVAKDGGRTPVEINAHLVDLRGRPTILSIARDVTKRLQAEEALKQSEARFRAIFEGAAIGIVMVDLEGRIIEVNPAAQKMSGYRPDEVLGRHFSEISFPADMELDQEFFSELASGKRDLYQVEKRYVCKEGKLLRGSLTVSLVRDSEGQPRFAIGMVEDITARKNAEEALQEVHHELERRVEKRTLELAQANLELTREVEERRSAEEALRESQEELHTLTSQFLEAQEIERRRISIELHDELGQALMLLKFKLSSLADKPHKNPKAMRKDYDDLLNYLDGIIENIRRLSRDLSPTILEELGLSSALRFLLEEFSKYSDINNYSFDTDEIDHLFSPQGQINIYRIFQESLTNIVKHSQAQKISVVIKKHDDYVSITVQDDGKGFDVEQTLAQETSQRGLGLAAMHERVRMAGGSLNIWSQPGSGTRITFTIPTGREGSRGDAL